MYHSTLRTGAQRQLKNIGKADLVIGLPTHKNAHTAAHTARIALEGAEQYYPDLRTVLINADTGLKATTRRAVMDQAFRNGHNSVVITGRYDGLLGQGNATAALLDAALALDAKAVVILDTYSKSISPNWIAALAHLILEDKADLVTSRYHQWLSPEGILCDLITYPLFRALWGQSVRCPTAPDFALSPHLATALLDEDIWGTAAATFGLPPWLVTYGGVNSWRVAQSAVGEKCYNSEQLAVFSKSKNGRQVELQFKAYFQDVLNVMFSLAYRYRNFWKTTTHVQSLPTLTRFASEVKPTPAPNVDIVWLLDNLALGWIEYRVLWQQILTPDNLSYIEALAALPPDRFYFPADLWAQIIYDFILVFNKGEVDPVQVVNALFPLYQGRLAAFLQEVAGLASAGREGTVAAQAVEFEETRPYLKKRWLSYPPRP